MWTLSDHLLQLACMAMIVWGAQAFARRANRIRVSHEARRLRVALHVGLCALRKLYEDNAANLSGGERPLNSGRNLINLLRTQLGRLTALEPPEVEAVMAACIAAEAAETGMAVAGRKVGAMAYRIAEEAGPREPVASALREVCSLLRTAESLLSSSAVPRFESAEEPAARLAVPTHHAGAGQIPTSPAARGFSSELQDDPPNPRKEKVRELSY